MPKLVAEANVTAQGHVLREEYAAGTSAINASVCLELEQCKYVGGGPQPFTDLEKALQPCLSKPLNALVTLLARAPFRVLMTEL